MLSKWVMSIEDRILAAQNSELLALKLSVAAAVDCRLTGKTIH